MEGIDDELGELGGIMGPGEGRWMIDEYAEGGGRSRIREFLEGLTGRDKVEAWALIKLLEERGNDLRPPKSKALGKGLHELRGHQVRIFYMFRVGRRITLLDGIVKKEDRIPSAVLDRVRGYQRNISALDAKYERGP